MSTELLKRRLTSLRSLTQEIRNSTTDMPLNIGHLKHLLQQSKNYYDKQIVADSINPVSFHSQIRAKIQYQPLFAQTEYEDTGVFDKNNSNEQIAHLREQNSRLQNKLEVMKQKIYQLELKIDKNQELLRKPTVPFFKIAETLNVFLCRMRIDTRDYKKVQYSQYEAQLSLDKLMLLRKQKLLKQEFDLITLLDVKYEGDGVLVLQFQEEPSNLTSIFIKFGSRQLLHKWDLALYTNFQMINSLDKPSLFQPYFRRIRQQQAKQQQLQKIALLRTSESLNKNQESYLRSLLLKRKQQYSEIQKLINQKLQRKITLAESVSSQLQEQNIQKNVFKENTTKSISKNKYQSQLEYRKTHKQQVIQYQQKVQTVTEPLQIKKPILSKNEEVEPVSHNPIQISRPYTLPIAPIRNQRKSSDIFKANLKINPLPPVQTQKEQFPSNPPSLDFFLASQITKLKAKNEDQQRLSKITIVNQFKSNQRNSKSIDEQSIQNITKKNLQNQQKLATAIRNLQTGYFSIKYSKDGFNPHPKKVFLSLDCKKLCWSEPQKQSDYKSVPLQVIKKITYPSLGEGISKHIKNPDLQYFCVIQYLTGNFSKKTIQLGCGNVEDIKSFYRDLVLLKQHNSKKEQQF